MRLLAFGCSLTHGFGLPDCFVNGMPGEHASKLAWPALLGSRLNLNVVNKSISGSSNERIAYEIISYPDYQDTDVVLILWSYIARGLMFKNNYDVVNLMPTATNDTLLRDMFFKTHNQWDLFAQTLKNIHHAECFLKNKKVRFINLYFDTDIRIRLEEPCHEYISNLNLDLNFVHLRTCFVDKALDNIHPGVKSQENLAGVIHKIYKEKYEQN